MVVTIMCGVIVLSCRYRLTFFGWGFLIYVRAMGKGYICMSLYVFVINFFIIFVHIFPTITILSVPLCVDV